MLGADPFHGRCNEAINFIWWAGQCVDTGPGREGKAYSGGKEGLIKCALPKLLFTPFP